MDTQSERLFIEALDRAVAKSQTLIIATHREAILQMCDRIIVIDGGRIVAARPRADILARTSTESATREPATRYPNPTSGRAAACAEKQPGRNATRGARRNAPSPDRPGHERT